MLSIHMNIDIVKHSFYTIITQTVRCKILPRRRCISRIILRTIKRVKLITTPFKVYNYVCTKETRVPVTSVY